MGYQLFGDLPIYVSHDSVDVWANQEIFLLDVRPLGRPAYPGYPRIISARQASAGETLCTIGKTKMHRSRSS